MSTLHPWRPRRWLAWLTLWAVVLAALAPTVSRALWSTSGGAVTWVEVCTAQGARWLPAPVSGPSAPDDETPAGAPSIDHCPLCVLVGERLAPPAPDVTVSAARVALPSPCPEATPWAVVRVWAYLRPPSRGPPVELTFSVA